jgi:hypothetical protein
MSTSAGLRSASRTARTSSSGPRHVAADHHRRDGFAMGQQHIAHRTDLLREHLGTLTVQPRKNRLTRNDTPHPRIVAHARSARKGLVKTDGGEPKPGRQPTGSAQPRP